MKKMNITLMYAMTRVYGPAFELFYYMKSQFAGIEHSVPVFIRGALEKMIFMLTGRLVNYHTAKTLNEKQLCRD